MNEVVLLAGPTASGKSDIAIKIAKKIDGEIINADSMQVYKEFKILSARPLNYKKIKHHLYGFLSIKKSFSTGQWLREVNIKIENILKRKKIPIVVGGTGLYFKALTDGIAQIPNVTKNERKEVMKLYNKLGPEKFYQKLIKIDPKCKNKISPNDKQRLIRFYEVKLFTKKSIFNWQKNKKKNLNNLKFKKIFLNTPRDFLLSKIEKRFQYMMKHGALKEAKKFNNLKIKKELSANHILGLQQIVELLKGKISEKEAIERSIIRTRQYIKRQMTWFRGQMKDWEAFNDTDKTKLEKKILKYIRTT